MAEEAVGRVVAALAATRRYRHLAPSLLERVAREALAVERGRAKAAVDRARRKLHQAHGAYVGEPPRWDRMLARLREAEGPEARAGAARDVLSRHASSREREPHLEAFWAELRSRVASPRRVLDLAAGLNGLSRPWSGWPADAEHVSVDVDREELAFVGACLDLLGVAHREILADLVAAVPDDEADVALLLKAYPCLERQRAGAGLGVLRAARAPVLVVSFPTQSLGGRDVGMRASYAETFEPAAAGESWRLERAEIPGELIYLVFK